MTGPLRQPASLGELLQRREGSSRAIVYINGSDSERRVAYSTLLRRAVGLLHHLQSAGAAAGSEVVLLTQRNEALVDAFWACALGAMVAVPVAPGQTDRVWDSGSMHSGRGLSCSTRSRICRAPGASAPRRPMTWRWCSFPRDRRARPKA